MAALGNATRAPKDLGTMLVPGQPSGWSVWPNQASNIGLVNYRGGLAVTPLDIEGGQMQFKASDSFYSQFTVETTSGLVAPDALPTITANKNGVDDATFTLTAAALSTGLYKITGTVPAGYVAGDVVIIRASFAIGGITYVKRVDAFRVDSSAASVSADVSNAVTSINAHTDAQVAAIPTYAMTKNTAFSNFHFLLTDSTNHLPATGKTVTATRCIDGAASFSACANSVVEVASGVYKINLAAADLNGDCITFLFTAPGCDSQYLTVITQS